MKGERLLVCRTAWMREYRGDVTGDPPYAGGKYIEENVVGGEVLNFKLHDENYYGYVQAPRGGSGSGYGRLDLTKHFGVPPDVDSVEGVEVVWFAAAPDGTGQKVVGIYHNATVLREARDTSPKRHVGFRGEKVPIPYNVTAKARDVRFMPVDLRRFFLSLVPAHRGLLAKVMPPTSMQITKPPGHFGRSF